MQVGTVKQRTLYEDGMLIGTYSENRILNSILYEVEFPDGTTKPYAANMIAQNIHDTVDSDGHRSRTFGEILNYCADGNAVSKANQFAIREITRNRQLLAGRCS